MVKAAVEELKPQYKIRIYAIGAVSRPDQGIFSAKDLEARLQGLYEDGYDLFAVQSYDRVKPVDVSIEHFWTMYLFKLRE